MQTYTQFAMRNDAGVANAVAQAAQDTLIVLDNSISMHATDWPPTRWGGARQASEALLEIKANEYPQDRVGIVAFGSSARILHPLANVRENLIAMKFALEVNGADGSTNMVAGLTLAESMLQGNGGGVAVSGVVNRVMSCVFGSAPPPSEPMYTGHELVIILLTDGHSTGGRPESVATKIKAQSIRLDTIGIGGSPSEVDESLLREMSSTNPDGTPRYCFIGDQSELVTKFQTLARHIRPI